MSIVNCKDLSSKWEIGAGSVRNTWYAKNVKLLGIICIGYPDEKYEMLGFFSNNVLAVRIPAITTMKKHDQFRTITPK